MGSGNEFEQEAAEEREAVRAFQQAVESEDYAAFVSALNVVDKFAQLPEAFESILQLDPSLGFRRLFLDLYAADGDKMRSDVNDDRLLTKAFRVLLPPYDGKGLKLWRGANLSEHQEGQYGHAWTSDQAVARSHASKKEHGGRGVLLEADAPVAAIISAVHMHTETFHEREYILDGAMLGAVRIVV